MKERIGRRQALLIVLLLFMVSVLLRLPNLNRPLSKHHEYNTSVILVNIESWRQAGGGDRFHYIPLLNYQNPGDKRPEKFPNIDSKGNYLYLSFAPGWYVIPYFIYQVFHLPVEPIYLKLINLFFELATVILLFLLCEKLVPVGQPRRYLGIILTCILFMFSPAILWYLGNGYTHPGIMMPFVIAVLLMLIPMLQSADNIRTSRLLLLFLLIVMLMYIDWFGLFLSAVSSVWTFFKARKDKRYIKLLFTVAIGCITAIAIFVFQFASYTGIDNLIRLLLFRFHERSFARTNHPFPLIRLIAQNIVTSYLPVILLMLSSIAWILFKKVKTGFTGREIIFMAGFAQVVFLYNTILLQWSAEHEFGLIPLSLLLVIPAARLIIMLAPGRAFYAIIASYFVFACFQYYFINRPGKVSWDGSSFDMYKKLGEQVQKVPADYKIFINYNWSAVIDFYAHRNFTRVSCVDSAKAYMQKYNISKAVWINHRNFQLQSIDTLR